MINQQEIRHQMRRRRARLDPAEHIIGAIKPRQSLTAVLIFDRTQGRHLCDEITDLVLQRGAAHVIRGFKGMTPACHPGPATTAHAADGAHKTHDTPGPPAAAKTPL